MNNKPQFFFTENVRIDLYTFTTESGARYLVDTRSLHVTRIAGSSNNRNFEDVASYRLNFTPTVRISDRVIFSTEQGEIVTTPVKTVEILLSHRV